jgi:malate permease and related proteins
MTVFTYIFSGIILPIFLLAAIGFIAQRTLKMDSRTFSRINIYILVPAVLFTKIYYTNVTLQFVGTVLIYITAIEILMMLIGEIISRLLQHPRSIRKSFVNSLLFFNSGNYGLPLVEMAFKNNLLATTSQIFILLFQNIAMNTIGVFQASSGKSSYRQALKDIFMMPTLYVLAIVLIFKVFALKAPDQILVPLQYLSACFVGFALITLGVQLADIRVKFRITDVLLSSIVRLVLSPVLGLILVLLLDVKGVLAQSLIIGVSTPTAVNTAIIAREFDNEPEYASQIVLVSTLISTVSISIVLLLVNRYFT